MNDKLLKVNDDRIVISHTSQYTEDSSDQNTVNEIENMKSHLFLYLFLSVLFELCFKVISAITYLSSPDIGIDRILALLSILISYCVFIMTLNIFYFYLCRMRRVKKKQKYLHLGVHIFSYIIAVSGFFLFIKGEGNPALLFLFAIPYMIVSIVLFIRECYYRDNYFFVKLFYLIDSVQLIYIFLKLNDPESYIEWKYCLFFYLLIALASFVISAVACLAILIILITNCTSTVNIRHSGNLEEIKNSLIFEVLFYIAWTFYANYKLIIGIINLLEDDLIQPNMSGRNTNKDIQSSFIITMACGTVSVFSLIIAYFFKTVKLKEALIWKK